ncbi:hypothetical protein [Paenibacillus sp. CECT 9249]|nr:hypothetical protein [Paenibacillus sp. CECT 9249]
MPVRFYRDFEVKIVQIGVNFIRPLAADDPSGAVTKLEHVNSL